MGVAPAFSDLNTEVSIGAGGTRILKPFRSCGVRISRVDEVIWRKPLSQNLAGATRPAFSICVRMYLPRSPSTAFHTVA